MKARYTRKAKDWAFCTTMLICLLLTTFMGASCETEGVVIYATDGSRTLDLYSAPGEAALGSYYNGTVVGLSSRGEEWSLVQIGSERLSVEGYMKTSSLIAPGAGETLSSIKVGCIRGGRGPYTPLLEAPDSSAPFFGYLLDQTRVMVIGDAGEYCHVKVGTYYGFVASNCIQMTETIVEPDMYADIPEIGYVYLHGGSDTSPALMPFPEENGASIEHPWLSNAQGVAKE